MKRNITQDVIPPKKTIRNVELFYKPKRPEKTPSSKLEEIKPAVSRTQTPPPPIAPPPPPPDLSYKYEYDEPVKRSKKVLYISIGLLVFALFFGISALFKSAEIRITPKNEVSILDENFKATKNASTNNGLGFQVVTTVKDVEKKISATDEQMVEKKAQGKIVVYNNYSTQPQSLIKTTRFETPEGLIFRATENIVVPGIQVKNGKNVAGSVEVSVEADKPGTEYNVSLKDFTIVGFKGTPKYTKFYARSKTEMSGGFSGLQKTVSKETIDKIDKELEVLLKDSLLKEITSQIPENFVLYQNSISYKLESTNQVNVASSENTANSVILKKKGVINGIIFDKGSLSRAIVQKLLPDAVDNVIKITNLDNLNFTFVPENSFDPNSTSLLNFNLKGEANFVWVFDENKLKSELLGMSKKNAITIISTYNTIKEAGIETNPFWNQTIPEDPNKVTLINVLEK